jgi:Flp pilus assembly protein TadG
MSRMPNPAAPIIALLRRLTCRREGVVLVIFALAAIPVMVGAGIAIDTARAYIIKARLRTALDAAALAVGSEASASTSTQLQTDLNNFFYDNYCKQVASGASVTSCLSTAAAETQISVQANGSITGANVSYTATATIPTTFMRLVGINNLTVSVSAGTTKFPGMEIAVVLDNTGSMLCGPSDGAPNYSNATCAGNVVTTDTTCTNATNESRICTLRNAALQFVTTLENEAPAPNSIYMSIVPYVTTVNVGYNQYATTNSLCTSSNTCSNIATDAPSGDFIDERGNILPTIPVQGTTTSGSANVSSASIYGGTTPGYQSGAPILLQGMPIYGHGIPSGTTVSSVNGTTITLSQNATLSYTGNQLVVGPASGTVAASQAYTDPTTCTVQATWSHTSATVTITAAGASGTPCSTPYSSSLVAGAGVNGPSGDGISGLTIATAPVGAGSTFTVSSDPSVAEASAKTLTFSVVGDPTSGSTTISHLQGTTSNLQGIVVGMVVTDSAGYIPASPNASACQTSSASATNCTYVTSVNTTSSPYSLTLSNSATGTAASDTDTLTFTNLGATTTSGSETVSNVSFGSIPTVGYIIAGNGIPPNTTITAVGNSVSAGACTVSGTVTAAEFAAGTGCLTISKAAVTPSNFSTATGTCCDTALQTFAPITYDSTFNTTNPTTSNWGGCVVEPTSSDENSSQAWVVNSSTTDPDVTEPSSGWPSWYPLFWYSGYAGGPTWPTIDAQNTSTETQGAVVTDYDTLPGPNAGCPAPILPLTNMTTTAGQTAITNEINSLWPKDSAGTQVAIGLIWGWRVLSPSTPFPLSDDHPYSYSQTNADGWKKIIVLMTDGTEEWPTTFEDTGLGTLSEGKLGTTSTTNCIPSSTGCSTEESNENTRLQTLCDNIKASSYSGVSNYTIYTIGLGSDGASNTTLQNCATKSTYFYPATPTNLATVFQDIAASIVQLRLTQ